MLLDLISKTPTKKEHPYINIQAVYLGRLLIDMNLMEKMYTSLRDTYIREVFEALNIDLKKPFGEKNIGRASSAVKRKWRQLDAKNIGFAGVTGKNLTLIKSQFSLSSVDCKIFGLAYLLKTEKFFEATCDLLGNALSDQQASNYIAKIIDEPIEMVIAALRFNSQLRQTGCLTQPSSFSSRELIDFLPITESFHSLLTDASVTSENMVENFVESAVATSLTQEDFDFLKDDLEIIKSLISGKGKHVLIYGDPGTGKTELAKVSAKILGAKLYNVPSKKIEDETDYLAPHQRLAAFASSQNILSWSGIDKHVLLFDEVEDIFPDQGLGGKQGSDRNKAYVNYLLETSSVSSLWICNSIQSIDPAYIRRFSYVLKLNVPPRSKRLKVIRESFKDTGLSERFMNKLSEHQIAPAIISNAAKAVHILPVDDQAQLEKYVIRILDNVLTAMGHKVNLDGAIKNAILEFDLSLLNTNRDIEKLFYDINPEMPATFAFYGPPGTGKTELGKQLARQVDKPLLHISAADLLSPYVGETEQNIKLLFERAQRDDVVVLLDEADSFLRDRQKATQRWEVGHTNELLVQMEKLERGIFICSTNLMKDIDRAALRRFDYKVGFKYMTNESCLRLFLNSLGDKAEKIIQAEDKQTLFAQMKNLTPGDFATVARRHRITNQPLTPESFYTGLKEESEFKSKYDLTS
jgi:transitional endoplasmic reticulum ATPase